MKKLWIISGARARSIAAALALGACVVTHPITQAEDAKAQRTMDKWNKALEERVASAARRCGFTLAVKIDETFLTSGFTELKKNAGAYCGGALDGIRSMCANEVSKEEIKGRIRNLACKPGKDKEASFNIAGDTLEFTVGPKATNLREHSQKYLEDNL